MDSLALNVPRRAKRLVAVVAAMPEEVSPLAAGIPSLRGRRVRYGRPLRGSLGGGEVMLACTGEGRERALRGTAEILDAHPVDLLLGVGTAGGLTADLACGTVVVASRLHDGDGPAPGPDPEWVARALAHRGAVEGTVLTSDRILCSAAEKVAARSRMGATGPAVVDLESAAFAAAAARAGVPCLIVRAVCDAAEDDLPLDLNLCRGEDGRIDRLAVVRRAVRSPAVAWELLRLRKRVAAASGRLARFVLEMLEEEYRANH